MGGETKNESELTRSSWFSVVGGGEDKEKPRWWLSLTRPVKLKVSAKQKRSKTSFWTPTTAALEGTTTSPASDVGSTSKNRVVTL